MSEMEQLVIGSSKVVAAKICTNVNPGTPIFLTKKKKKGDPYRVENNSVHVVYMELFCTNYKFKTISRRMESTVKLLSGY
mgnify:CR=1 FL=1